jgi:NDP-sugar pyrophosphorylase family protein
MKLEIRPSDKTESLYPLTCTRKILECPVGTSTLGAELVKRLSKVLKSMGCEITLCVCEDFWPSAEFASSLCEIRKEAVVYFGESKKVVAWISADGNIPSKAEWIPADGKSFMITAPWHLLSVNEDIIGSIKKSVINGEVRKGVTVEGNIIVGKGTVILPGVYIDGNVVFGEDCKIGPNCYFRGNTFIGNKCHVGQAVEIKNSILMEKVAAGHLSYVGDSIIGAFSNLGAGTITANFRHDGKSHRAMLNGELVDTGRRKLGVITGDHVHTGIHTSIYPGRKIWPEMSTRPGDIVSKDIMP